MQGGEGLGQWWPNGREVGTKWEAWCLWKLGGGATESNFTSEPSDFSRRRFCKASSGLVNSHSTPRVSTSSSLPPVGIFPESMVSFSVFFLHRPSDPQVFSQHQNDSGHPRVQKPGGHSENSLPRPLLGRTQSYLNPGVSPQMQPR